MKIFILLVSILALTMCHTIPMMPLFEASPVNAEEDSGIQTQPNFDMELQKLNLTSLRTLLIKANLFNTLNDTSKSYTVFAPTNKAIENSAALLTNTTRLPEILKYHVHLGAFRTSMIERDMRLKTLLGGQQKIRFEFYSGIIYGSCQQFGTIVDQTYDNGMLHELNGVMVPPEADFLGIITQATTFETLQKYVSKASLKRFLQTQDPATFLAPNDAAFKKLAPDVVNKLNNDISFLHKVLEYHFLLEIYCYVGFENGDELETYEGSNVKVQVSGGKVVINNSTIIQNDTIAYNGVFHVIDTVLLPPDV